MAVGAFPRQRMTLYPGFVPVPVDPGWAPYGAKRVAAAVRRLGPVRPAVASGPRKRVPSPEVSAYLADRANIRAKIRRSPGWIGGYAAVYLAKHGAAANRPGGMWYRAGCFDRAVHETGIVLLKNHESGFAGAVFARKCEGTMILTADSHGLWFEATVPELLQTVDRGATCSIGGTKFEYLGKAIAEVVGLWEISILDSTKTALCPKTWVHRGPRALSVRAGIAADFTKRHPYRSFSLD